MSLYCDNDRSMSVNSHLWRELTLQGVLFIKINCVEVSWCQAEEAVMGTVQLVGKGERTISLTSKIN